MRERERGSKRGEVVLNVKIWFGCSAIGRGEENDKIVPSAGDRLDDARVDRIVSPFRPSRDA